MTTVIPEENGSSPGMARGKKPKANKKTHVAPPRSNVVPAKPKLARKVAPAKKALKGRAKPEVAKAKGARDGFQQVENLGGLAHATAAQLRKR